MPNIQNFLIQNEVAHISRLYQAGLEYEAKQYFKNLPNKLHIPLQAWSAQLLLNHEDYQKELLPTCVYYRSMAWTAYYNYQYIQAHDGFVKSIEQEDYQQLAYDTALGLCKIYTRSGHWHVAQQWAIYYLSLARLAQDDFALTKGYAALAEIFLRAYCPQESLSCFQIANNLMPIGQGQQDKQYNYIASALLRNQEKLRAETLLRSSKKISKDKWDKNNQDKAAQMGYLHSLARLHFLLLEIGASITLNDDVVSQITNELNAQTKLYQPIIPLGFLYVASGIYQMRQHNLDEAKKYLQQAKWAFTENAPMEYQWVSRLLDAAEGHYQIDFIVHDSYQNLLSITPVNAPDYQAVLDKTWADTQIFYSDVDYHTYDNGFEILQQPCDSFDKLAKLWRLFCI